MTARASTRTVNTQASTRLDGDTQGDAPSCASWPTTPPPTAPSGRSSSRSAEGCSTASNGPRANGRARAALREIRSKFARALSLRRGDLHSLPMQVVSTGLPYLIVPVSRGLERARIVVEDFEERLASVGAKFVYVFDPDAA